ncbi:hypothetical protein NAL33_13395 [Xanthomonas oryzae pv. oryzae]|nr:hypothetical protein NAL33_13395 [Xanthomonas oryzae pv. oryzae]
MGQSTVTKIDAKSVWTLDDGDAITGALQYTRHVRNGYRNLTKEQIAATGYDFGYVQSYKSADPVTGSAPRPTRSAAGSPTSTVSSH